MRGEAAVLERTATVANFNLLKTIAKMIDECICALQSRVIFYSYRFCNITFVSAFLV